MEEHNNYAVGFINATRWIKANLPACQGQWRRVEYFVQLPRQQQSSRSHARCVFSIMPSAAGMDMGIVNAGMLEVLRRD